ncbi:TPR-like protein [Rhizoclosmatium globosum]|uniref:TPR-like protein n=1 Tax=Rhizoclosmatium globosum TaxID=329046 RepID=A0A1Y2CW42_9FUNG|nr:TPR-like protein [Rhizoclosmatium globosum]|eukprot:ORY50555.1 TPR-like protein [Rhizoclosmatium globosum]
MQEPGEDSFLALLENAQPAAFEEYAFYDYQDDGFDEEALVGTSNGADFEANPNWIPADIEQLMAQAAGAVNLASHQILGQREQIEGDQQLVSQRGKGKEPQRELGFDELQIYGEMEDRPQKGKGKRGRKPQQEEPTVVEEMMGECREFYVHKKYPEAFKLLYEIIKIDNKHAAAWKLLAVCHDELGDPAKALQANFMAAHLDLKDAGLWKRLAEISQAKGNTTDTLYCLTKAISADPTDTSAWFTRSVIYADNGQLNRAIQGFNAILQVTPYSMQTIQELARIYMRLHEEDERWRLGAKAGTSKEEVEGWYDKGARSVEIVTGRLEAGILDGKHYGIVLANYENVPLKFVSSMTHFDALLELEVEEYSDLFLEVIDAYMKKRMFALAVGILEHIVQCEKMNVASVWAKMADCFQHLGRLEDAVDLYRSAIEVEPRQYDWQLQLAEIYEALGESDHFLGSALRPMNRKHRATKHTIPRTNETDYQEDPEYSDDEGTAETETEPRENVQGFLKPRNPSHTQDKAVLLAAERLAISEHREWYAKMLSLELKLSEPVKRADFVRFARKLVIRFQSERRFYPADRAKLYEPRGYRGEEDRENEYMGLAFSQWFEVFTAYDANIYYHNDALKLQLRLYMIASATVCGNYGRVVELAKAFCVTNYHDNDMYRLYCAVLNGSIICFGLKLYLEAYTLSPRDPLINLSVGLAYIHWAMQRRIDDRHKRILQGFTFLYQYEEIRGGSPEALYNIGRAFHQLGLNHLAVEYYERVLKTEDMSGLWPTKEAAYNLALILHANGSSMLAQAVLEQHITF